MVPMTAEFKDHVIRGQMYILRQNFVPKLLLVGWAICLKTWWEDIQGKQLRLAESWGQGQCKCQDVKC